MPHVNLTEGMRRFDLEDLVLPLVSVDEFESKVSAKAIVFGFFVGDQNAARDLNRFIQKCAVEIIDTDISPAPDQRGYFLVFVEMLNNDMTAKNLLSICEDLRNVSNIKKWQMRIRGSSEIVSLAPEPIVKHLAIERKVNTESLDAFLAPSRLRSVRIDEDRLLLDEQPLAFVDFADVDYLLHRYDLCSEMVSLDPYVKWQCDKVRQLLGEGWLVDAIGSYRIIHRTGCDSGILLRGD